MPAAAVRNDEIATLLERVAALLEVQGANPHRVRAYRRAGDTLRGTAEPVRALVASGDAHALEALPGIGKSIGALVFEYVHTGRCPLLDRLEGQVSPEDLFTTVPGIGDTLAHRLHDALGAETLEELEVAAHDGRLERVPGLGPRRAAAIRDSLAGILSRSVRRRARARRLSEISQHDAAGGASEAGRGGRPEVATLLAVDADYRSAADRGELPRIAPRRFNPSGAAWLPVLHEERDGWHVTALFSNTARAHELGRTGDWVVLYCERDGHEDQYTVVTEQRGPLAGRRVVRGREMECAAGQTARGRREPGRRRPRNRPPPAARRH